MLTKVRQTISSAMKLTALLGAAIVWPNVPMSIIISSDPSDTDLV